MNLPFFEESNAIFANYTFREDHLKASQELSGDNSRKIYAGVDVFGRGNDLRAENLREESDKKVFLLTGPRSTVLTGLFVCVCDEINA